MTARRRLVALFLVLTLALGFAFAAEAREVIQRFDVLIEVRPDGAIEVTETIRITVEGVEVRRGIEREIPLLRADGRRASFEVLEVRRGDADEPYTQQRERDRVLVRIGRADRLLPVPSVQVYTIRYRSAGQLRGFAGFDELYWNVTGDELPFAIEAASVVVLLPDGIEALQDAAYTGPRGARGTAFRVTEDAAGRWAAETTAVLRRGHGFTIAVGWPKGVIGGVVEVPQRPVLLGLPALLVTLPAALAASLLLAFGLRLRFCGGPRTDIVYPRFQPPEGLSPAACRYVLTGRVDDRSLTACIVGLASKGALTIKHRGGRPRFTLLPAAAGEGLHPDEEAVREQLFPAGDETGDEAGNGADGEPVVLGGSDDRVWAARLALEWDLERSYRQPAYRSLDAVFGLGLAAIIALVAAAIVAPYRAWPELAMLWLGLLAASAAVTAVAAWWLLREERAIATRPPRGLLRDNPELVGLLLLLGMSTGLFGLHGAVDLAAYGAVVELAVAGVFGPLLGGLVVVFARSLVVPTSVGRRRLDAIDGLVLYLSVAEADRLEMLHPPERTIEHFEELLPYAIALGYARSWTRQFAQALGTTRPTWYVSPEASGEQPSWDWLERDRLADHVRATKRSSRPFYGTGGSAWGTGDGDWSSGGSSGGGYSGGGGGGGGTRGW